MHKNVNEAINYIRTAIEVNDQPLGLIETKTLVMILDEIERLQKLELLNKEIE